MEVAEKEKVRHPAKFSRAVLDHVLIVMAKERIVNAHVLDPFAGIGGIHFLSGQRGCVTYGVELEPEWASQHPSTIVGDALDLPFESRSFDAIVTSPCYGNRMADHHNARDDSRRNTYKHALGRDLSAGSSAGLQWGKEYRTLHRRAWVESRRVLKVGGLFVLNIKNHIRAGEVMPVAEWHLKTLLDLGLHLVDATLVNTPGLRYGENHEARVGGEWVFTCRRVE